jgi:exodeoxyribonuclease VII small subunit
MLHLHRVLPSPWLSPIDALEVRCPHKAIVSILRRTVECSCNIWLRALQNYEPTRPDRVNVNPTPVKKPEPPKKPDFEKSLVRLEEVVRRLESPQLSLDDAMKLFEEGVALSRECQKQLEEAEGRVEILLKKADGKLAAEPFDPERENES